MKLSQWELDYEAVKKLGYNPDRMTGREMDLVLRKGWSRKAIMQKIEQRESFDQVKEKHTSKGYQIYQGKYECITAEIWVGLKQELGITSPPVPRTHTRSFGRRPVVATKDSGLGFICNNKVYLIPCIELKFIEWYSKIGPYGGSGKFVTGIDNCPEYYKQYVDDTYTRDGITFIK